MENLRHTPILYNDTLQGKMVGVDNYWAITTDQANRIEIALDIIDTLINNDPVEYEYLLKSSGHGTK